MTIDLAWITCDQPGCDAGMAVDGRHARNFDGRDWYCRRHESEVP